MLNKLFAFSKTQKSYKAPKPKNSQKQQPSTTMSTTTKTTSDSKIHQLAMHKHDASKHDYKEHAAFCDNTTIYFFGKTEHIDAYHVASQTWESLNVNHTSLQRNYPTCQTSGNMCVIFGGCKGPYFQDVLLFNMATKKLTQVQASKSIEGRAGHGIAVRAVHGDLYLYVFGGYMGKYLNDMHVFDFKTLTWTEVEQKNAPSTRSAFAQAYNSGRDSLFIHGGCSSGTYNDMYEFLFATNTWVLHESPATLKAATSHCMVVNDSNQCVYILSRDDSAMLHCYDPYMKLWTNYEVAPECKGLADYAMVYHYDRNSIFVHHCKVFLEIELGPRKKNYNVELNKKRLLNQLTDVVILE